MTRTEPIPAATFAFRDGRIIPRLGYGAMRLTGQPGNFGPYADWQGGIDLLRRARALGIRHVDTARAYGPHHNERLIAEALRAPDGRLGDMFVASKGGVEKDADGIRRDTRPETLDRHVDESRAALGVERIDLYYLHAPDGRTPVADSVAALEAARAEGRIARIGLSNVDRAQVEAAMAVAPVSAVQNRYSPADAPDPEEEALIDWLAAEGVAYVPHGPLGARPMRRGAAVDAAWALRTLLARAPNVLVIPGTTARAHLEANAAVLGPAEA